MAEWLSLMTQEAAEAPAAVARHIERNRRSARELGVRLRTQPPPFVMVAGRGSSTHAGFFGKYLIETRLGLVTASASPSIITLYGAKLAMKGALFIAISQSGRSPDLIAAAEMARAAGAITLALVNRTDSPLAMICHHMLPLHAGPETSVAATKSYLTALAGLTLLTAEWSEDAGFISALDRLPSRLEKAVELRWLALESALQPAGSVFVLGRGLGFAVAKEAALKLKETACLHAEALSAAEMMHGPLALIRPGFPVLIFDPARRLGALEASLREMGAETLRTGAELAAVAPLHPALDPLPLIASFYIAAARLAAARGYDPDHPPHLAKVTETR